MSDDIMEVFDEIVEKDKKKSDEVIIEEKFKMPKGFRMFLIRRSGSSSVLIQDEQLDEKVTVAYDYSARNNKEVAARYLAARGIKLSGEASGNKNDYLFTNDFHTRIK